MAFAIDETTRQPASLELTAAGELKIAGTFSSEPPVGAATDAKLDDVITAIEGITVPAPVGGATAAKQDAQITQETASATSLAVIDDWDESDRAKVNPIVGQAGVDGNTGAATAKTVRVALSSDVIGKKSTSASVGTVAKSGGDEYETVAASQTDQVVGATGATGDYLEGVLCVVATAATSQVQIKDGAGSAITVLPNAVGAGIGSYYIPLGLTSAAGAWKITTAAGVSVIAMGDFT